MKAPRSTPYRRLPKRIDHGAHGSAVARSASRHCEYTSLMGDIAGHALRHRSSPLELQRRISRRSSHGRKFGRIDGRKPGTSAVCRSGDVLRCRPKRNCTRHNPLEEARILGECACVGESPRPSSLTGGASANGIHAIFAPRAIAHPQPASVPHSCVFRFCGVRACPGGAQCNASWVIACILHDRAFMVHIDDLASAGLDDSSTPSTIGVPQQHLAHE